MARWSSLPGSARRPPSPPSRAGERRAWRGTRRTEGPFASPRPGPPSSPLLVAPPASSHGLGARHGWRGAGAAGLAAAGRGDDARPAVRPRIRAWAVRRAGARRRRPARGELRGRGLPRSRGVGGERGPRGIESPSLPHSLGAAAMAELELGGTPPWARPSSLPLLPPPGRRPLDLDAVAPTRDGAGAEGASGGRAHRAPSRRRRAGGAPAAWPWRRARAAWRGGAGRGGAEKDERARERQFPESSVPRHGYRAGARSPFWRAA